MKKFVGILALMVFIGGFIACGGFYHSPGLEPGKAKNIASEVSGLRVGDCVLFMAYDHPKIGKVEMIFGDGTVKIIENLWSGSTYYRNISDVSPEVKCKDGISRDDYVLYKIHDEWWDVDKVIWVFANGTVCIDAYSSLYWRLTQNVYPAIENFGDWIVVDKRIEERTDDDGDKTTLFLVQITNGNTSRDIKVNEKLFGLLEKDKKINEAKT